MPQAWTQEDLQSFDQNKLEELWADEEFDKAKNQEPVPFYGHEPLYANQIDDVYGNSRASGRNTTSRDSKAGNGEIAQRFMYGVAGLLLLTITFLVIQNTVRGSGQKLQSTGVLNLGDKDLQTLDTKGLIAQAVSNQDYRLAVRLQYLDVLKRLDEKKWIKWTANKTNQDYVGELSKHKLGPSFNLLTYHFDYTWYGDFQIEEKLYKNLEAKFHEFHQKISGR